MSLLPFLSRFISDVSEAKEKPQAVALSRATIFRKLCFLAAGNIFINFLPEVYEPGTSRAPDEMVIGEATVSRRGAEGKLSFACASQKNYTELRAPFFDSSFAPASALIDGSFGNWIYPF